MNASGFGDVRIAGRYVLETQLGKGGMGVVYSARDEVTGTRVALKQLSSASESESRQALEALFELEYHTLVRLRHPRITEVYDYGVTDAGPYYTMELLEGEDLQQKGPMPYRELCRHLRDIASSLALIHTHRLVHRDVSPRNVRFTREGRAKLIDFGALARFGIASEIVGTPACTAPESLLGMPLDQRADLYALGAIAYWALTGRLAYPAKHLSDLLEVWQVAPEPPSHFAPDVPPELDALVLSLLKTDPAARPGSAAVVIDALTTIAGLEPEEHDLGAESYLSSGGFIGREAELQWIERRIQRVLVGEGAEIIVNGSAGMGKTRLLHEACLSAQLKGAGVLKADARATPAPFGVATALALQLLTACPRIAQSAAQPWAALIGHLSPVLLRRLGEPELEPLVANPAERRARLQTALHDWFFEVARQVPLVVSVDNLHAADDNSAAFLAALGHSARERSILLLLAQTSREEVVAPTPVRALRQRSAHVKLGGLTAAAYDELVRSLFGDVPNTPRLANLLYEKSAGNPQLCMELVQLLVKKQFIKYVAGTWVLPLDLSEVSLPTQKGELMATRLSALSEPARALAEALSVHTRPVPLEQCRSLVQCQDERVFHTALDELCADQILLTDGKKYWFAQEAMRKTLSAQMDETERQAAHKRAAMTLLDTAEPDIGARMQAGFHLLHAGEESRGADLLARAGSTFLAAHCASETSEQALRALVGALDVYDRQKRSKYEIARVLFPLLPLAYFSDWRLVLQHGERAVALGLELTGLTLAQQLRPYLGRKLALLVGLVVAGFRFAREQKRGLECGLIQMIGLFCASLPTVSGVMCTCLDSERASRLRTTLEPLGYFGNKEFPRLMYDHVAANLGVTENRVETLAEIEDVMARLRDPKIKVLLGEGHWKAMYGGEPFMAGLYEVFMFGTGALERARQMDELGVRVWSMVADHLRLLHHAMRGESEQLREYSNRVELFAVQGSTTWQVEMFYPTLLFHPLVLSEDTLAVRRTWEQLARIATQVPSLSRHAESVHAAYLMLRGDLAESIAEYERLLPMFPPLGCNNWAMVRIHFARALNNAGQCERASTLLREILSISGPGHERFAVTSLEAYRQLALCEAGLGRHEQAARELDGLLAKYAHEDQPLLLGLLHQARADVALLMRDEAKFHTQSAAMEARFRTTKNPALAAQCERLRAKARRAGLALPTTAAATSEANASLTQLQTSAEGVALSQLRNAADPSEQALMLLMRRAGARAGYLYLRQANGLRLLSSSASDEPRKGLETELLGLVERAHEEANAQSEAKLACPPPAQALGSAAEFESEEVDDIETAFIPAPVTNSQHFEHQLLVLSVQENGRTLVLGGVILNMNAQNSFQLNSEFLQSIASVLQSRFPNTLAVQHA